MPACRRAPSGGLSHYGLIDEAGPPPNDVDVAVVSGSLTRFDLAEVRLDVESESKLSINLFVFERGNERLPELRASGVPVFERVPT